MSTLDPLDDPAVIEADIQAVVDKLANGKPIDPEVTARIHERSRRITEEVYKKFGLIDHAVPSIRELRGELPDV